MSGRGFSTRAVHDGQSPDPATGAVNVPIYASSTYAQEEIGKHHGYEYSRVSNPTRTALEESLASLEGGASAHVFSSGMAAIAALVAMLKTGDHVICGSNVYGGTPRLFDQIIANYGIRFTYVDTTDPDQVRGAIEANTRLVHIETPTNPLMQITDIRAIADICHEQREAGAEDRSQCRQHIHVALFSAPSRVWCGPGDALDDQVSQWPQRRSGWRPGGVRRPNIKRPLPSCRSVLAAFFLRSSAFLCCAGSRRWRSA